MTGLNVEVLYSKETNTRETLEMSNFEQHYPDFTESFITEDEDHYIYHFKMRDLQKGERIQQMADKGIITVYDGEEVPEWIDAEAYSLDLQRFMYRSTDPAQCGFLDFAY